jgi:hypothetical protein
MPKICDSCRTKLTDKLKEEGKPDIFIESFIEFIENLGDAGLQGIQPVLGSPIDEPL